MCSYNYNYINFSNIKLVGLSCFVYYIHIYLYLFYNYINFIIYLLINYITY